MLRQCGRMEINVMNKVFRSAAVIALSATLIGGTLSRTSAYSGWADKYINFCNLKGIITGDENGNLLPEANLTREQMVKMILTALSVDISKRGEAEYDDVSADRWSYPYISKYIEYVSEQNIYFSPEENVRREEFLAMCIKVAGYGDETVVSTNEFNSYFSDWDEIEPKYYNLIVVGYEKSFISGTDNMIKPKDYITRAEACAVLYKLIYAVENDKLSDTYGDDITETTQDTTSQEEQQEVFVITTSTPLTGPSEATLEQAKQWAKDRGAEQRYIDVADLYWKYGEITGIRADVLYAQAAKETNFGKYTGQVKPEQNNWAGIKKYGAVGDAPEDHEDFETPEDGVRGHFNHMCAYVGFEPVGEPHERYKAVKSISWAGTIETIEQLGGKWCPTVTYGVSIINDFLTPMINTQVN